MEPSSFSSGELSWSTSASSTADMEAAEALADLAHLAMGGNNKFGNRRKRVKKQVKSESPFDDSVSNSATNTSTIQILVGDSDQAGINPDQSEPVSTNEMMSSPKTEADADLPSSSGAKHYLSFGGGRSRQNLTEAEKEARKQRRILANRESARQTIRRRQALFDDLNRKAADLSWENENLKREKELALKVFEALETTNKNLKAQIAAEVIKTEAEKSRRPKSTCVEVPINPATNRPYCLHNHHSFSPIFCPSVVQSSNAVQPHHGPQKAIFVPSNYPMPTIAKLDSSQHQQENINGPRGALYMLSYPLFFSVPDHGNGIRSQPIPGFGCTNDENSASNGSIKSLSAVGAHLENQHCSLPVEFKPGASTLSEVRVINDINETPTGTSPDEGGECEDPHAREIVVASVGLNSEALALPVKNESGLTGGILAKTSRLVNGLVNDSPEKGRDILKLPSKKSVDAAAAAEARKRRKELTKLKNLYGRQCRTRTNW